MMEWKKTGIYVRLASKCPISGTIWVGSIMMALQKKKVR